MIKSNKSKNKLNRVVEISPFVPIRFTEAATLCNYTPKGSTVWLHYMPGRVNSKDSSSNKQAKRARSSWKMPSYVKNKHLTSESSAPPVASSLH